MNILVVTTHRNCPAVASLQTEGWLPTDLTPHGHVNVVTVENDYTDGQTLHEYWAKGDSFINVEHDMCPWPGAMKEIWECDADWCVFGYPAIDRGALGVVRFSKKLIERFPNANWS